MAIIDITTYSANRVIDPTGWIVFLAVILSLWLLTFFIRKHNARKAGREFRL